MIEITTQQLIDYLQSMKERARSSNRLYRSRGLHGKLSHSIFISGYVTALEDLENFLTGEGDANEQGC